MIIINFFPLIFVKVYNSINSLSVTEKIIRGHLVSYMKLLMNHVERV